MNSDSISELSKLKVIDLRAQLAKRGLSTTGKKEDLIERLSEAISEQSPSPTSPTPPINQKASLPSTNPPSNPSPSNPSTSTTLTDPAQNAPTNEALVINLQPILAHQNESQEPTTASISSLDRLLQRQKRFGETTPNSLLLRTQEQQRLQERMRKFST